MVDLSPVKADDLPAAMQTCDVFWFRLGFRLDASVLTKDQRCRVLATPVTGIDHIDEDLCESYGIKIVCLGGELEFLREIRATAEHTLLLAMSLMRRLVPAAKDVEGYHWRRDVFRGHELYQKNVGIVGFGRLGQIVANYFHCLGCQIHVYDIADKQIPTHYTRHTSLEQLIRASEIVTLHIPYNDRNHHFIDDEALANFDKDKILINTSRGGVIDEQALVEMLVTGRLAGVAMDVLEGEPFIAENKLVELSHSDDRVLITPHIGGNTYESFEKTEEFLAKKIAKLFQRRLEY